MASLKTILKVIGFLAWNLLIMLPFVIVGGVIYLCGLEDLKKPTPKWVRTLEKLFGFDYVLGEKK